MTTIPYRFLALGDSYTIGESILRAHSWPVQLAGCLHAEGNFRGYPAILAQTGWTTRDLLNALAQVSFSKSFDLVSLMIGVNNQYQGLCLIQFQQEIRLLLQNAINLAGGESGRVIVLSIPDWSVTPFAAQRDRAQISEEIETYNALILVETKLFNAYYLDITPISRRARVDPSLLAGDGLHPSPSMYASWVAKIYPIARHILSKPRSHSDDERLLNVH